MKRLLLSAAMAAITLSMPSMAADVGVSVSVGQPGFYGRIDIGDFPQPRVIYAEPMIVHRGAPIHGGPIYLRVPPGHSKHWNKHCHEYHACGERVFFVRDDWYEREYVPRYQERYREHPGKGRGNDDHSKPKQEYRGNDNDR